MFRWIGIKFILSEIGGNHYGKIVYCIWKQLKLGANVLSLPIRSHLRKRNLTQLRACIQGQQHKLTRYNHPKAKIHGTGHCMENPASRWIPAWYLRRISALLFQKEYYGIYRRKKKKSNGIHHEWKSDAWQDIETMHRHDPARIYW